MTRVASRSNDSASSTRWGVLLIAAAGTSKKKYHGQFGQSQGHNAVGDDIENRELHPDDDADGDGSPHMLNPFLKSDFLMALGPQNQGVA